MVNIINVIRTRVTPVAAATGLLAFTGIVMNPTAALAATNPPTVDQIVTVTGNNTASITITTTSSELIVGFFGCVQERFRLGCFGLNKLHQRLPKHFAHQH
jgi:hypothetical protein